MWMNFQAWSRWWWEAVLLDSLAGGGESKVKCMKMKKVNCSTHWNIPRYFQSLFLFMFICWAACCSPFIVHYISARIESTQHKQETFNPTKKNFQRIDYFWHVGDDFNEHFHFRFCWLGVFLWLQVSIFSYNTLRLEQQRSSNENEMCVDGRKFSESITSSRDDLRQPQKSRRNYLIFDSIYGNVAKERKN